MSGISEEQLQTYEEDAVQHDGLNGTWCAKLIAEIRQLRAENERLEQEIETAMAIGGVDRCSCQQ